MKKLSICIPTYNRGEYIGETIASIVEQMTDEVELVISDNASTDNTAEVVGSYQSKYPGIRYVRLSENKGADRNFLNVVDEASGDYCWFMGSDDVAEPGSIARIMSYLERYPEVSGLSVNQIMYSTDMASRIRDTHMAAGTLDADRVFDDAETCFSSLGQYFGYIPGQVVNRALWKEVVASEPVDEYFNAFVHVYVIGRMIQRQPYWVYVDTPCVGYRSGNDSFLQEGGIYKRQVIAHVAFTRIVRDLFGLYSAPYKAVLKIALERYMRGDLARFKRQGATLLLQWRLFLLYSKVYWRFPYYWVYILPIFFIPNGLVGPLIKMVRRNSESPL